MRKKTTQADRIGFRMRASERQWRQLLQWSKQDYCDFKFECGCRYMEVYLAGDIYAIDEMLTSAHFWGWWKMQWLLREERYLWVLQCHEWKHGPKFKPVNYNIGYRVLHDPVELAKAYGPYGRALDDSYSKELVPSLVKG